MNNINFIELNKFGDLHNNHNIFFCKTDFLFDDFKYIERLNHDIVLITGNSDYAITDSIVHKAPSNIKKWFAQNAMSNSTMLEPLPIGLENKIECARSGHGIGYKDRMTIKERMLSRNTKSIRPTKNIYANFNVNTNLSHRSIVKNLCQLNLDIDWHDDNLSLEQWFDTILDYKMIICPMGNGLDTHRLWEVLYSHRIPVTIRGGDFKLYDLYKLLPIIILDSLTDLQNTDLIMSKYNQIVDKSYDNNLLSINYWKSKILDYVK